MTNERQIRIGIIGAGSIGSLFGGYLAKSQSDKYQTNVIFFGREEHIEAVNEKGLSLIKENTTEMIDKIKGYVKP
jgi:2-dehydropantoate 2-reductase